MQLKGIGQAIEKYLARLGIFSVQDVLFHFPLHYQDRTHIQSTRQICPEQEAVVEGTLHTVDRPIKGKTKLLCELRDEAGRIHLRFFHVFSYQLKILRPGVKLRCYGMVKLGLKGLEMIHPEFKVILPDSSIPPDPYLTAVYPATEGLGQHRLRQLTGQALAQLQRDTLYREWLPSHLLEVGLPTFAEALLFVHRPPQGTSLTELANYQTSAHKRLIFEELLAHRLSLLTVKQSFQTQAGITLNKSTALMDTFLKGLAFTLTAAQKRVVEEIAQDLSRDYPMLRLVQGDVGSGKTVVAALSILKALGNNYQAALMVPTELLAEQHYRVFCQWFEPLGIQVVYLSGSTKGRARVQALQTIATGTAQVVIGTHALFQEDVCFSKLALIVVDEQHRFGVHQRAAFREKGLCRGQYPHQLIMTATPIPRTLAMSFYADLDCSTIDELPPGRTPIVTTVIANSKRDDIIQRIREACQAGRQAYWVCPLIDESELITGQAATQIYNELTQCLPELKIGLVHGRLSAKDKEKAMQSFKRGETQLLVATTVIEVGVDVPNASLMIIENAERLGLSQLHQLRGRVGRGHQASYCVLMYQYPLSPLAKERLNVMRETTDGFKIAQCDLELRGPGEILGTRQTGELTFRLADLIRDRELLSTVQQIGDTVLRNHPEIIQPLIERWLGKKEIEAYGKV